MVAAKSETENIVASGDRGYSLIAYHEVVTVIPIWWLGWRRRLDGGKSKW